MRISDWGSDVCSSDLAAMLVERDGVSGHAENFAAVALTAPAAPGTIIDVRLTARDGDRMVAADRQSVVQGKRVSVRVDLGGRRIIKKKKGKLQITESKDRLQRVRTQKQPTTQK